VQSFGALPQIQNEIGAHRELRFFQLFEAVVHYLCIAMDEKNSERAPSVRSLALRPAIRQVRLKIVLSQV
jgi:hypothetical protein